jgi:ribosomal protein S12 methylthiotransferase
MKQERQTTIMEIQKEISEQHNESLIGKMMKVLIDTQENKYFVGRTEWDAPEIDQEVLVHSDRPLNTGTFHSVTITDATEYDLVAKA